MSFITPKEIEFIISEIYSDREVSIENFQVHNASDKMLGFLADYLKLKIIVKLKDGDRREHNFFIKAIPKTNEAKAEMVKEWKLFDKEMTFYRDIKKKLQIKTIKPWSPELIAVIDDAMVFQDMDALEYRSRDKLLRFDFAHSIQCLKTLARFHASSIIYEEKRTCELGRPYTIEEDFGEFLDYAGYVYDDPWLTQCRIGALEVVKEFSKFRNDITLMSDLNKKWDQAWLSAVKLNEHTDRYCNVLSHRDLWNNNILFHYDESNIDGSPDDCYFVDFQAIRRLPPACDVMVLLYCNLDPVLNTFLESYYDELALILGENEIDIKNIISKEELYETAEVYRKWAAVVCACLVPQFWISDELITTIFTDTERFQRIMCENKGEFIKSMIEKDSDYKVKVVEAFDEIIERYCIEK